MIYYLLLINLLFSETPGAFLLIEETTNPLSIPTANPFAILFKYKKIVKDFLLLFIIIYCLLFIVYFL